MDLGDIDESVWCVLRPSISSSQSRRAEDSSPNQDRQILSKKCTYMPCNAHDSTRSIGGRVCRSKKPRSTMSPRMACSFPCSRRCRTISAITKPRLRKQALRIPEMYRPLSLGLASVALLEGTTPKCFVSLIIGEKRDIVSSMLFFSSSIGIRCLYSDDGQLCLGSPTHHVFVICESKTVIMY